MNYFNVSIFIIATFLLIIDALPKIYKPRTLNVWKEKNPSDEKMIQFGRKAVVAYNQENHLNSIFSRVVKAEREYEANSKHYHLEISTLIGCAEHKIGCPQIFDADIYQNYKSPKELTLYVHEKRDAKYP
uniref:Cystatin domain-containing protein n=1 Tax=Strongyloides papillosus TaxID=174720 RepID=A0A0N5BBL3_STREA